jgi:hypothetical protein
VCRVVDVYAGDVSCTYYPSPDGGMAVQVWTRDGTVDGDIVSIAGGDLRRAVAAANVDVPFID